MSASAFKNEIVEKIAQLGEVETAEVRDECALRDLGIDSLLAIELVVFIERMSQRSFPEDRIGAIETCGDVFRELELLLGPS